MKIVLYIVLLLSFSVWSQYIPTSSEIGCKSGYKISKILISGNVKTKDFIINRELDFKIGDLICSKKLPELIEINKNRIFNSGLFVSVHLAVDTSVAHETIVLITVQERFYTIPNIVFELADRSFNEWWYQRGHQLSRTNLGFGLQQHNIRGRNETFKINLQGGFTKNISLGYQIPYLNKKQTWGAQLAFGYTSNKQMLAYTAYNKQVFLKSDTRQFYKWLANLAFTFRPSFFTSHKFTYEFARLHINDSLYALNTDYFAKSQQNVVGNSLAYTLIHDKRNIQAYATKGNLSVVELKKYGILPSDYYKNTTISISHSRFYPLPFQFYVANKTKVFYSVQKNIPYYNLKALGYNNDYVRGYDLYVIDGTSYGYNKFTIRKKLWATHMPVYSIFKKDSFKNIPFTFYLNGYADVGYAFSEHLNINNSRLLNRSLEGFGLGIDMVTAYDFVLRTEYSFNELGEKRLFVYITTDILF
ncbi:MAG: POTRA domain-containing protein [Cytophagales bacterium]